MRSRLSTPLIVPVLMGLILSVMFVSGCGVSTQPVGPQEPVEPQEMIGPDGKNVGPQETVGPKEIIRSQKPVHLPEPVGQGERIGPADPVILVARVLKLVGFATQGG